MKPEKLATDRCALWRNDEFIITLHSTQSREPFAGTHRLEVVILLIFKAYLDSVTQNPMAFRRRRQRTEMSDIVTPRDPRSSCTSDGR